MNRISVLICLIFSNTFAFAQTEITPGVRAGITSAFMKGDAPDNLTNLLDYTNGSIKTYNHTGFYAGAYIDIPVGSSFSVEPGIYFSQKGYDMKGNLKIKGLDFAGAMAKASIQSNYIDVPVYLKATTGKFSIFAGPQISYLVNSNLNATAGVLGINLLNQTLDATNSFHRWDAAVAGGVSYKLNNGLNFSATYDYGILKADANRNVNAFNHAIKAAIGLNF